MTPPWKGIRAARPNQESNIKIAWEEGIGDEVGALGRDGGVGKVLEMGHKV